MRVGTFGGGSVLFGKSVIELVKSTIQLGSNEFKYVGTYVMLGLTFVCLFLQVGRRCRARTPPPFPCPLWCVGPYAMEAIPSRQRYHLSHPFSPF